MAIWGLIIGGGVLAFYAYDLPDIDDALADARRATVTIHDAEGATLATIGDLYGLPVRLRDLPPALPLAVLATEDRRFYRHFGIDVIGLARALITNINAGRIKQGGSTITQQVAKNLFLTPARTIKRKVQETLLAFWLETRFTKDQIFTVYLNRVYLGAGAYGVEAAAQRYFGRSARQVSTYQAALLAGLLKAPSRYNPLANPKRAHARTKQVLANMVAAGYITAREANHAKRQKNVVIARKPARRGARYFIDWVLAQIPSYVSSNHGDIIVETTLNSRLQRWAQAEGRRLIERAGKAAQASEVAAVSLTADGAVRVMVGGKNYGESQFNRATQARRQPGSAFKPIIYLAGLEAGFKPDQTMVDSPVRLQGWQPRNFDRKYRGTVRLDQALAQSINTIAVQLGHRVGVKQTIQTARRLGITAPLPANLSLTLGAAELSLLELTAAYAPFANGGRGVWPYGIRMIRDKTGRILYRRGGSGPGRVVSPQHVADMNAMLTKVITEGTGKKARLNRPAAGKTGTSQQSRDAWFIGYTADLVTGVWLGNDTGAAMKDVTGGGLPAQFWQRLMTRAHQGLPVRALPGLDPDDQGPQEKGFWERIFSALGDHNG